MKKILLILLFFSLSFGIKLNQTQIDNIKLCLDVVKYLKYSHYPCSILLNESSGLNVKEGDLNLKKHSYGIMQVQLDTAKFVIRYYKLKWLKMSDYFLKERLKNDKIFNITIGSLYFNYLYKKYHNNLHKAVIAYNSGYYNPKNRRYFNKFYFNNQIITLLQKEYF